MQKIRIFLASSNELKADREQFEIAIYRKCKTLFDEGIFIHLDVWEDLSDAFSQTHSQDEYNKMVHEADIFVLLAYSKVGMYTAQEFEQAFGKFKAENKPFIFAYFKDDDNLKASKENRENLQSLWDFQEKLSDLGYFYPSYKDSNDLIKQFIHEELERLRKNNFTKNENKGKPQNAESENTQEKILNQSAKKIYNIEKIDKADFS
jgi:hypothetical protein